MGCGITGMRVPLSPGEPPEGHNDMDRVGGMTRVTLGGHLDTNIGVQCEAQG